MKIKNKPKKQSEGIFFQKYMTYILFLCIISQSLAQQKWGGLYGDKGDIHVTNKDRTNVKAGYGIRGKNSAWWYYQDLKNLKFNYATTADDSDKGSRAAIINRFGRIFANKDVQVKKGIGNSFSFWGGITSADSYKIHFGKDSYNPIGGVQGNLYKYGDVTDFAIKTTMSSHYGRGWVWGLSGETPVAALSNSGSLKIKEHLTVEGNIQAHLGRVDVDLVSLIVEKDLEATNVTVHTGSGNGLHFLNDFGDTLKITEGNSANYHYGHVSNWSIKTTIPTATGATESSRGFTWGPRGQEPIASLTNDGTFQIKNDLIVEKAIYGEHLYVGGLDGGIRPNVKITVDGRVYISEVGSIGRGFEDLDHVNYENYLLWIEKGMAVADLHIDQCLDWCDYVFDPEYKLPSLKQIENTILEKGHLHTMPSAKVISKQGYKISDMTKRILLTVEELTLHMINQEKKLDDLFDRSEVLVDK
jgi:hypothetical protein